MLYDRAHPGTSYLSINPQSLAQVITDLAFAAVLTTLIVFALLRAYVRHRRYRRRPGTPSPTIASPPPGRRTARDR